MWTCTHHICGRCWYIFRTLAWPRRISLCGSCVAVNTVLAYHILNRTTDLHVIHPLLTLGAYLRCATRCSPIAASRVFAYTLTRRHTLAQMMPRRSYALLPQRMRRKCSVTINIAADYFSNWVPGRRVTCRKPREDSRCGSLARTGA